ncbi:Hypothetical protein HVR_LOCUS777 [uncultured virus]|nr:Hypothetical protein HVR_LOCUS777 [uncultured virus]
MLKMEAAHHLRIVRMFVNANPDIDFDIGDIDQISNDEAPVAHEKVKKIFESMRQEETRMNNLSLYFCYIVLRFAAKHDQYHFQKLLSLLKSNKLSTIQLAMLCDKYRRKFCQLFPHDAYLMNLCSESTIYQTYVNRNDNNFPILLTYANNLGVNYHHLDALTNGNLPLPLVETMIKLRSKAVDGLSQMFYLMGTTEEEYLPFKILYSSIFASCLTNVANEELK